MLTGNRADVTEPVGPILGVTEICTALSPAAKLTVIRGVRVGGKMIMVGDDVNDASALAAADTGVAMGVRGAVASLEAVDIVLLVDRLDRFVDVVRVVHCTYSMALQSAMIGMSLSLVAMVVAALGHLLPLANAMLQGPIDVLAIASALRALLSTLDEATHSLVCADVERLRAEHAELESILSRVRLVAGALPCAGGSVTKDALLSLSQSLTDVLVPHERRDGT